jgi:hypothetical protein
MVGAFAVASIGCLVGCDSHATPAASTTTSPLAATGHIRHHASQPRATYPLTGLPVTSKARARRPALSVKIDNISVALPQAGLNNADIVTEALVEGGLTRLFATFQSHDAPTIGPIRSARPVDADLLRELNGGIFAYSGADPREIAPSIDHSDAALVSMTNRPEAFQRDPSRYAPDNVMSSSKLLYSAGASVKPHLKPPPHLFRYSPSPAAKARHVHQVSMNFSAAASASWTYTHHEYRRTQDGAPDTLLDGSTVTAQNVVILTTKYYLTSIIDDAGNADPYDEVTGSGKCWVLRDGTLTTGRWTRPSYTHPVVLRDGHGKVIALHPGRTWIELLPPPEVPHFS